VLLTGAGLVLRLAGNATSFRGAVYDAGGRRVRSFAAGSGQVFWDGRDTSGALVHPGVYFVRVEAGGRARTVRVALLR
jgi:flagellar hook assembly protein FlgD